VFNNEDLTLDRVAVTDSTAWSGGGVANRGSLTILRSLIADNTAFPGFGGGVFSQSPSGSLTVTNSTVTGNEAQGGGGILVNGGATVTVTGSTIAGNHANFSGTGGLDVNPADTVQLTDTLIANNTQGADRMARDLSLVNVTTFTADHVLVEADTSSVVQNGVNGNLVGADPKLAALADNGGPTRTMALLAGSPALGAGSADTSADQRGLEVEGTRDIGAFEAQAPTGITLSGATVAENAGADVVVGTLAGTDPDSGDAPSFSLVAGAADNALFHIANGQLVTHASFDFEAQASYTVRVRATDSSGLTFEKDLAVTVTDVNEAPTLKAPLPSTLYKVRMNTPRKVPAKAGVLKAFTDTDGDALTAVLVTAPARSKGKLTLRPNGSFTFVPRPNVRGIATFVVQAKDARGVFSPTLTFTIRIT
jgi:hypothetical protein